MDVGRGEEIRAARHQSDALQRVVDADRKMVARRRILARQHHVAERERIGGNPARRFVFPVKRPSMRQRLPHIEAQREGRAGSDPIRPLRRRKGAACAGIERPLGPLRRVQRTGDLALDRRARAEAGID